MKRDKEGQASLCVALLLLQSTKNHNGKSVQDPAYRKWNLNDSLGQVATRRIMRQDHKPWSLHKRESPIRLIRVGEISVRPSVNSDYTEANTQDASGIGSSKLVKKVRKSSSWGRFFISTTCGNSRVKEIRFVPKNFHPFFKIQIVGHRLKMIRS